MEALLTVLGRYLEYDSDGNSKAWIKALRESHPLSENSHHTNSLVLRVSRFWYLLP